jgi:hypothetical protein
MQRRDVPDARCLAMPAVRVQDGLLRLVTTLRGNRLLPLFGNG